MFSEYHVLDFLNVNYNIACRLPYPDLCDNVEEDVEVENADYPEADLTQKGKDNNVSTIVKQ